MRLFDALAATWPPAETRTLGPWTLRRGAGGGNRVSAATLDGPMEDPAIPEMAMRDMGQQPLFMIRPGQDDFDAALAARGYVVADATVLMRAPTAGVGPDARGAILCERPLARMAEIWQAGGIGPARMAVMVRAPAPKVWLLGRLGDRPAGCGFVAISDGVAMLHALEVAPALRRQGLAAAMTRAAAAWAQALGADTLALAVMRANAPARALYGGLGMAEAGGYHYRRLPRGATR